MPSKISVVLLKGKSIGETSDINKMAVHLEQILTEKDQVDFKVRQSLTEPAIKTSEFIVICGSDTSSLSELFKALSVLEALDGDDGPTVFLYDEPGIYTYEQINSILTDGMDAGRVNPKVFNKIVNTTSYRDIIGYIDVALRKIGTAAVN
jgi:hypothetical protein